MDLSFAFDVKLICAICALIISVSNLGYYAWSVFYKSIRPHSYTWIIWGIITVVAVIAQYQGGGGYAIIHLSFVAVACFTIALLGFLKGHPEIHRTDKICLASCLAAIALWMVTGNPYYSVFLITVIDLAGYYPTIRKSWNNPYNENLVSFFLYGLCFSLQIAAIKEYNFLTTFYPVAIALSAYATWIYLIIRRQQVSAK